MGNALSVEQTSISLKCVCVRIVWRSLFHYSILAHFPPGILTQEARVGHECASITQQGDASAAGLRAHLENNSATILQRTSEAPSHLQKLPTLHVLCLVLPSPRHFTLPSPSLLFAGTTSQIHFPTCPCLGLHSQSRPGQRQGPSTPTCLQCSHWTSFSLASLDDAITNPAFLLQQ